MDERWDSLPGRCRFSWWWGYPGRPRPPASAQPSWPASQADARGACVHGRASPSWSSAFRRRPCLFSLKRLDVRGRWALVALLGVVAHLCALGQRLEAVALDRAVVHEQVLAGVIRRDESEALVVAEPLHCSCGHLGPFVLVHCERGGYPEATTAKTRGTTLIERMLDPRDESSRSFARRAEARAVQKERLMGFEPTTFCMASRRSSQLS